MLKVRNTFWGSLLSFGVLLLTLFFAGCENEQIKADVLSSDEVLFENTDEPIYIEEIPDDWTYGAIVTPDESLIGGTLKKITNKEEIETVVLLTAVDHNIENRFLTYTFPGVLEDLSIEFDKETIKKLIDTNFLHDLEAAGANSGWNRPFMWTVSQNFPNAKFVLIGLNNTDSVAASSNLAAALRAYLPKKSLVIALTRPVGIENANIREFQTSFSAQVLTNVQTNMFGDLPIYNRPAVTTLGYYLLKVGARRPVHAQVESNLINVFFQKGVPPDNTRRAHLVFFGDLMLGRYVRVLMDSNGLDFPFRKMNQSYLQSNDLLIANLEGPITNNAVSHVAGMNFGFFTDTAQLLQDHHFDLLSLANNHAYDKGADSWTESINLLKAHNITPFGHPHDIVNESVAYKKIGNHMFAFLGLEDINSSMKTDEATQIIEKLSQEGFKVIVFPHWGQEYIHRPTERQRNQAYSFINAGAFAVVGHHPHVEQTYENYKGRPIFYSLGNAVFDQYWSNDTQLGLSIAMIVDNASLTIYLLPIQLYNSQMELMNSDAAAGFLSRFATFGTYTEEEKQQILNGKITIPLP